MVNPNTFTPSPLHYAVRDRSSSRSVPFGVSREKMKGGGIVGKSDTPAPGRYNTKSSLSKQGFTIYSKVSLPSLSNSKNPGPAHYNSVSNLNAQGKYNISQLHDSPAYRIGKSQSRTQINFAPGPGAYSQNDTLN